MQKLCVLLPILFFSVTSICQRTNPAIGKNEFETLLSFSSEQSANYLYDRQNLSAAQLIYRWALKKYTKVGIGGLLGVQNYDPSFKSDVVPYGAIFGDITRFIGNRQKWSTGGQIGHGIFKREHKIEDANYEDTYTYTAGMFYSISIAYRSIISKKILLTISPACNFRNFRSKATREYYSPSSTGEHKSIEKYSGLGLKIGLVF